MLFSKKSEQGAKAEGPEVEEGMEPAMTAFELLKKDHRTVSALFKELEETEEETEKVALAQQICTELTIHAEAEERAFYPAAREALEEESEDLIDEAAVEHRSLKMLIAEIDGSSAGDELFDANLKVLKEYVEHHVKEEEHQMFPKLEGTDFDADAVGVKLAEAKMELKAKVGEAKPRAGAKLAVHVPDLSSGRKGASSGSKAKGKTSKSSSSPGSKSKSARGNGVSHAHR